jgi:hypothetical protein
MTTPPTRPEPFDPRDHPDPLDAAEQEQLRWRFFHPTDADAEPRRRLGCSIFALVVAFALLIATPRSAPDPTVDRSQVEWPTGGAADPSPALDDASGPELSGAPRQFRAGAPVLGRAATPQRPASGLLGEPHGAPTPLPTPAVAPAPSLGTAADVTWSGIVNYAEPRHGRFYLAIPDGPGVRVRICGPAGCLDRTSTDAGPALHMQRAGRIADLNSVDWERISGVPLRFGGFQGTILILKRAARLALPETDSQR